MPLIYLNNNTHWCVSDFHGVKELLLQWREKSCEPQEGTSRSLNHYHLLHTRTWGWRLWFKTGIFQLKSLNYKPEDREFHPSWFLLGLFNDAFQILKFYSVQSNICCEWYSGKDVTVISFNVILHKSGRSDNSTKLFKHNCRSSVQEQNAGLMQAEDEILICCVSKYLNFATSSKVLFVIWGGWSGFNWLIGTSCVLLQMRW
jgi:hypothetical protein